MRRAAGEGGAGERDGKFGGDAANDHRRRGIDETDDP